MALTELNVCLNNTDKEKETKNKLVELFKNAPIPEDEILGNLGLFIPRQHFSRILFLHEIYKKIIHVNGIVMEFGTRWGQGVALLEAMRSIYEPYNHGRKIVGFDSFQGAPSSHTKDGDSEYSIAGSHSVTKNYEEYLSQVLECHENFSPIAHIKKIRLIKGDATKTVKEYMEKYPETMVALAYFDFGFYEPTKVCLETIKPRLTKGSIVIMNGLNKPDSPSETYAVQEVFGDDFRNLRIERLPYNSFASYFVIE